MTNCPGCNFLNDGNVSFCGGCGAPLLQKRSPGEVLYEKFVLDKILHGAPGGWMYLASDTTSGEKVRIKEIHRSPGKIDSYSLSATLGFRSLSSLGLTNFFESDDCFYLVLRTREGESLDRLMRNRNNRPFHYSCIIPWMRSALQILEHLHMGKLPVILVNLCPSSFAISKDDSLFLWDPGAGFLLKQQDIKSYALPGFAAPEVFTGGEITPASDIFSVGAIFHYLLTGKNPLENTDNPFFFESPRKINIDIPVEFEKILMSMLRENPKVRPDQADKLCKKLERLEGRTGPAQSHLTQGIAAYNRGSYEKALKEFTRATLLDPEFSTAYFWRGMAHYAMGNNDKALENLNQALQIDPDYEPAYYRRGLVRTSMGDDRGAWSDFNLAISIDPENTQAFVGRALASRNMGKMEEAEKDCTRAIQLDPYNGEAYLWRSLTYHDMGKFDDAIRDCDRALEIEPDNASALLARGLAKNGKHNVQGAMEDIDRAILINPAYAAAYLERGIILMELRMFETAILDLNRSIELDPDYPEAYFHRGKLRLKLKDYMGSLSDLDKSIEMEPGVAEFYKARGETRRRCGDIKGAELDEKKYCELSGENV